MASAAKNQIETREEIKFLVWAFMLMAISCLLGWTYKLIRNSILLSKNWQMLGAVKPQINSGLRWILAFSVGFMVSVVLAGV